MKIKRISSLLLCLAILLSASVFVTNAKAQLAPTSSLNAYDQYLEKMMTTQNIHGVAYATQNGQLIAKHANGIQNNKENINITTDTLFPIGSVSKQFCATSILVLQEQGKLSANDTLSMYFPEYEIGKDITIHQLLCMRSGIRDHVNPDKFYTGAEIPTDQYTLATNVTYKENQKAITDWLFTQELKFTPGEQFDYSNSNFLLLSMIVEQVSGKKYSEFLKENILDPLKMTNTGSYDELYTHSDLAQPAVPEDYELTEPLYSGLNYGCGDLVSNGPDIDKWLTSLSKHTLMSEESYTAMTTNYGDNYGYGVYTDPKAGAIYHQGNILSYETFVITVPEKNINIFVVTNDMLTVHNNGYDLNQFAYDILNKVNTKTVLGDLDGDKQISILDATAIQLHIAQINILTTRQLKGGDTDGDGKVSVLDATEIQLHLACI